MESHTPIVVQGGGRFRGMVGPLLSVFFFILRYVEKFLPLIDGTGAWLLISMLTVLLLFFLYKYNHVFYSKN